MYRHYTFLSIDFYFSHFRSIMITKAYMKLYHYVHCPFCVRVRFALNYLQHSFESIVLSYDNEKLPIQLTGQKMLPIATIDGVSNNESLEIIRLIDSKNQLSNQLYPSRKEEMDELLSKIGSPVHNLAMPYWIWTPEFNEQSRAYFQKKKEGKRGPFKDLVKNKEIYINEIKEVLAELESKIDPYYTAKELTILDIQIASHLWGLYIVPEFQFSKKLHSYLQRIKNDCGFNYHEDFWR